MPAVISGWLCWRPRQPLEIPNHSQTVLVFIIHVYVPNSRICEARLGRVKSKDGLCCPWLDTLIGLEFDREVSHSTVSLFHTSIETLHLQHRFHCSSLR
jgi:hypothetical protein